MGYRTPFSSRYPSPPRYAEGGDCRAFVQVYSVTIIWDGEYRVIPVNEAEIAPLVGMGLLYGYELRIQAVEGGIVTIEAVN